MKLYISTIIIIILSCQIQAYAQVGINTQNPMGILHIDPQQNSPSITSDDVVFSEKGLLGVGTTTPSAQLEINTPSTSFPLRIVDGNEGTNKVILSDANGYGSWAAIRGKGGEVFTLAPTIYVKGARTKVQFGESTSYTATSDGNYMFFIRLWGTTTAIANNSSTSLYFYLYKNGTIVDVIEYYIPIQNIKSYASCTVALASMDTKKGDNLQIDIMPITGNFTTGAQSGYTPTKVTVFIM